MNTYSKARATPREIPRRRCQDKGSYASQCKASPRDKFLTYSYTRRCWGCSTQYPTSFTIFGCLKRAAFQVTSRNCSSSLNESETVLIFFAARILQQGRKVHESSNSITYLGFNLQTSPFEIIFTKSHKRRFKQLVPEMIWGSI